MKNKNIINTVLAVVILVIVALIIYALLSGDSKDKKKDSKKKDTNKEIKYEVEEQYYNDLVISDISVEVVDDTTVVSFSVTNNGSEAYPEGIITFSIESANIPAEKVTTNTSTINPGQTVDMEIIINGVYDSIDTINVEE